MTESEPGSAVGGGAVFHDLGNLNFTFLMREADYDLPRQLTVLERACRSLGIPAERSGRNDLLADGRKFSGNAFYKHNGRAYHHGTLMLDVDLEMVQRYLSPSKAKLAAKGVDSVRSRVVNLKEFVPDLSVERLSAALIASLSEVYAVGAAIGRPPEADASNEASGIRHQASGDGGRGLPRQCAHWLAMTESEPGSAVGGGALDAPRFDEADEVVPVEWLSPDEFDLYELTDKYRSDAWLYGQKLPFTLSVEERFPWGGVEIQLDVNEGVIRAAKVYTDAMDETLAPRLEAALSGVPLRPEALSAALPDDAAHDELLFLLRTAL